MKLKINIPNCLSAARILMIPLLVYFILHSTAGNYPLLIILFCISMLLDFFDGFLARRLHQETELGRILDPLADKLLVICLIIALLIKTDFPIWLAVIIFSRDILIVTASFLIFKGKHKIKPSNLIGKVTFALFGFLIMVYIVDLHPNLDLAIFKEFFIALSVTYLMWSWVEYYKIYVREKNARE